MTEHRSEHPDSEELLAYAEGQSLDAKRIESHLAHCEVCAEAVLIAQQVACLAGENLIPDLSRSEIEYEKDRLRNLFRREPLKSRAQKAENSPGEASGTSVWASLGAIGGVLGLGSMSGPKPMVAGVEPHLPANHETDSSGNSQHPDVTSGGEQLSSPQAGPKSHEADETEKVLDELSRIVQQAQEESGTPSHHDHDHDSAADTEHDRSADPHWQHDSTWNEGPSHLDDVADHGTGHDDHHDSHQHDLDHDSHHDDYHH